MARKPTIAQLQAKIEAQAAVIETISRDYVALEEYRRVQSLLRITQVKLAEAKHSVPSRGELATKREERRNAAQRYCAQFGVRSVGRDTLMAWVQAGEPAA